MIQSKFQQALVFHQQGQLMQARALHEDILRMQPGHYESLHLLGVIAAQTNDNARAVELIGKAIQLSPNNAAYYSNRGNALKALKQFGAAIESFNKAIALKPDYAEAHQNLGIALAEAGQKHAAVESFNQAIFIKPDYAKAYLNRGTALADIGHLNNAISSYDQALNIKPDYAEAYSNKALALLLSGDFANGFELLEWRWKSGAFASQRRNFPQPLWLGRESIAGKTILLHSEQGLGDTIQFCRYASLIAALGARGVLEVEAALAGLLTDLDGVSELVVKGDKLPAFDYQSPLLSLPLAFKTDLTSIPGPQPYIAAAPGKVAEWAAKLGTALKPRVGLVWSGSAVHKNDGNRSVPLSDWIKFLPDNFQYVSLQKELRGPDRETLKSHPEILHFEEDIKDFTDTAALCELVDVVISVDTSVAHLAGALGKQVWIVLPFNPDWRWLLDRSDSPWYPSARLYRQEAIGAWDAVFQAVSTDLRQSF